MFPKFDQLEKQFQPSILTKVKDPWLDQYDIELLMKRDDLLHPVISGNKWRKLENILKHALSIGSHTFISMGGAYSNHLHALAYTGKLLGIKTIGLIRGEQPELLNPTLTDLITWGMEIRFVSRTHYRELRQYNIWNELPGLHPGEYWIVEGGNSQFALSGVKKIIAEIDQSYDILCVPCGTGATLAGMVQAAPAQCRILGFAALKGASFLHDDVELLLQEAAESSDFNSNEHTGTQFPNWSINKDYHFGGFAKTNARLLEFISAFTAKTGIPIEPVYTGKMMYALYDLIKQRYFKPGMRIIAVHTGGLQGNRGSR